MAHAFRTVFKAGLFAGVAASALAGVPARAADVTAAQASGLERQVQEAVAGLLGPSVKLGDRVVQLTPAGDHYDVSVSLKGMLPSPGNDDMRLTGTAKQGETGVWLIEGLKVPSPLRFTLQMPVAPKNDAPRPRSRPAMPTEPVAYTVESTGQDGRIVWDPSFATPSTWTVSSTSTKAHAKGTSIDQTTSIGPINSVNTLRPAGADRVDVLMDGGAERYQLASVGGPVPLELSIERMRLGMALTGVSRQRGVAMVQSMVTLVNTALRAPATASGAPPPPAPELLRTLIAALQDFASDFTMDESADGMLVKTQGQTVALNQVKLGFDAKSTAGLLQAGMTLGVQGIALPDVPLGEMAVLIPTRVTMRPVVGNIGVAELTRLATAASEHRDPSQADIAALFSHGGLTAGLESLVLEVGGATLTGQGKLVATEMDPAAITGTAQLTIENFDALQQKVAAIPELAQQSVPVMVFVKGIGRAVDSKLVYDVVFKDNKVLINNVDLTAMAGGGAPAPAPAPRPPREPRPAAPSPGGAPKAPAPRAAPGQVPSWAR